MNKLQDNQQQGMKLTTERPSGYRCNGTPIKYSFMEKVYLYLLGYRFGGYLGIYKK